MVEVVVVSNLKNALRKKVLKQRLSIKDKEIKDKIILKKILSNEKVIDAKNILIYMARIDEVDTKEIILELIKLKKNIYLPRVENKEINFYKYLGESDLKLGKYNILEPINNLKLNNFEDSLIIVPGLLFDKLNNRLGYGGGYYDRFLDNKEIYKIGLCYQEFLVDKLPTLEHDIKMDLVITEE